MTWPQSDIKWAILANRGRARMLGWPRVWQPGAVLNPQDGQPFTPEGAWEFIAQVLDERLEITLEAVRLENPPGATGYVLNVPLAGQVLYINLQLGPGRIIGRSSHYSKERTDP
jgi:hypothetical protein